MTINLKKWDWWRVSKIASVSVVSLLVGYFSQPMISRNPDAVNIVVTIFSILAGFLIAVITLIVDPVLRQAKDWEELQLMKKTVQQKLGRQKLLFFLYLTTLGVALATLLISDERVKLQQCFEFIFLSLATFVFILSFSLPGSLIRIQMERYEVELNKTKPQALKDADAAIAEKVEKEKNVPK